MGVYYGEGGVFPDNAILMSSSKKIVKKGNKTPQKEVMGRKLMHTVLKVKN